jgi:acyl-coenzyme A synthetase/AMP-(fatty) acid ligase
MSIIFTLTPTNLIVSPQVEDQQNVVTTVFWVYSASEEPYTASINGQTNLTYSGTPFTPYMSLTENQVAEWVQSVWTPYQLTVFQQQLTEMINKQKTSKFTSLPLPWIK